MDTALLDYLQQMLGENKDIVTNVDKASDKKSYKSWLDPENAETIFNSIPELQGKSVAMNSDPGKEFAQKFSNDNLTQGEGLLATKEMSAGDFGGLAMGAVQMGSNLSGNQFETSANSSGPGKAGPQIGKAAIDGFSAGMATGNPIIAAGAGLLGGISSFVGHKKAMTKWQMNKRKETRKENALEKKKREEQYNIDEGLANVEALKKLRERQMGILR